MLSQLLQFMLYQFKKISSSSCDVVRKNFNSKSKAWVVDVGHFGLNFNSGGRSFPY